MSINNGNDVYNNGSTDADVQKLIDNALPTSGTPSKQYAINITGNSSTADSFKKANGTSSTTTRYAKLFTIQSNNSEALASGVVIAFSARDVNNNNKSGFIRFRSTNNSESGYVTILNSGNVGNAATTRFGYTKVSAVVYEIWAVLTQFSRISAQIISSDSTLSFKAYNTIYEATSPTGLTLFKNGLNVTKEDNQASIGSSAVPVYVGADGELKVCTNDFVHNGTMTDDNGGEIVEAPPQQVYETGKFYFVAGKVCRCTAYSEASATFDVYGVVEALNYVLSQT